MLACLAIAALVGPLITVTRVTTESMVLSLSVLAVCVTLGGLVGWYWQRWGRALFPLKSPPRFRPSGMFRQPGE